MTPENIGAAQNVITLVVLYIHAIYDCWEDLRSGTLERGRTNEIVANTKIG